MLTTKRIMDGLRSADGRFGDYERDTAWPIFVEKVLKDETFGDMPDQAIDFALRGCWIWFQRGFHVGASGSWIKTKA